MKKRFLPICACLLLATPVFAKTTANPVTAAPVAASSSTPVGSSLPVSSSVPAASATAPAEDNTPAAPRPGDLSPAKVNAGDMVLSGMQSVVKGSDIDFTMSVKNDSKIADKIIGASTDDWPGTSITGADGKPMGTIVIPAEGKVDVHLLIKGASSKQIKTSELPITFYFGRGPNTKLKIYVSGHESIGSKIMSIFK